MTRSRTAASTRAGLRFGVFWALWLASLASNIGGILADTLDRAAVFALNEATIRIWRLLDTSGMDRNLAVYRPEPHLVHETELESGSVVVENADTIAPKKHQTSYLLGLDVRD
jgi:hypothetical protein